MLGLSEIEIFARILVQECSDLPGIGRLSAPNSCAARRRKNKKSRLHPLRQDTALLPLQQTLFTIQLSHLWPFLLMGSILWMVIFDHESKYRDQPFFPTCHIDMEWYYPHSNLYGFPLCKVMQPLHIKDLPPQPLSWPGLARAVQVVTNVELWSCKM